MNNAFIEEIEKYLESEWMAAVEELLPSIHEVDRNAVRIWFRFYPLDLVRYLESADDAVEAMKGLALQGDFGLVDRIDTSHRFLYGHRFWPQVKAAIVERAGSGEAPGGPAKEIKAIAASAAKAAKTYEPLTIAVSAVGLMTLVQVSFEAFKSSPGIAEKPAGLMTKSPDAIAASRKADDSQGLFGFLKTVNKKFSVIYNESLSNGRFEIINQQEIASASANDRSQDWQSMDERCWEGPVPVECTSASCGTCWVGVLGGEVKLSDVSSRERRAMKVFGYNQPDDEKPVIRLACQARAEGNTTIVIPPWNAVFGKKVRGNVDDLELEPVTTSAKALRETVATAMSGD